MSSNRYRTSSVTPEEKREIHPIWRGIGCILIVIIPLMAYASAVLLIDENAQRGWFRIPPDINNIPIPAFLATNLPGWIVNDFYAKLLVAFLFALIFFALFTVLYSFAYRLGGGYRPSPVDAPTEKRKTKRSR